MTWSCFMVVCYYNRSSSILLHGVRSDSLITRLRMTDPPVQAVQAGTSQIFVPLSNLLPSKVQSFDDNLATTWKLWKQARKCYVITTGIHKPEGIVHVSTLLSIIGKDGVKAHDTFTCNWGEDSNDIELVLQKFGQVRNLRSVMPRTGSTKSFWTTPWAIWQCSTHLSDVTIGHVCPLAHPVLRSLAVMNARVRWRPWGRWNIADNFLIAGFGLTDTKSCWSKLKI